LGKAASACVSRGAVQVHARARNICLVQNEFKGDATSFEMQFEAVADKLLGKADDALPLCLFCCVMTFVCVQVAL
jgi:hypothetical protein